MEGWGEAATMVAVVMGEGLVGEVERWGEAAKAATMVGWACQPP